MTSWYSQLLTTTTTRITHLQRTLLSGDGDGDTEDDTHVCRVLRNHYTEKGRPFPPWLPPDPKAPPPAAPVYAQQSQVGSRYGGLVSQPSAGGGPPGLSSLWDNNLVGGRQDPQSLRQGRGAPPPMRGSDPAPASSRNPFAAAANSRGGDDVQARPLPSQRAGSYQQAGAYSRDSGGSTGSAQDRLKQRLWGGSKTASPSSGGPFQPPPQQQQQSRYGGGGSSGGGSVENYEDRFAPGGMYDASNYGSRGAGGGSDRPFVASNSPWAYDESEYAGGGGGRSGGLPSGPRKGGLPSGPRRR